MDTSTDYDSLSKEELIELIKCRDDKIWQLENKNRILSNNQISDKNINDVSLLEIQRYSRQLILPEFGLTSQKKLKASSVLIVGCGGLGCPASLYLAAAGVGKLGLVDFDDVELSNLHRQVLHTEERIGISKALSIVECLKQLNSFVKCIPHITSLTSHNALEVIKPYDVVLDCTDNVATRYLINDACVLLKKPLVSGSALRFDGQLAVYNHNNGPCYRCLFPKPPPPEAVTNCSDGGVLGVIPGVIGLLQALEAIKISSGVGTVNSQNLLIFNGKQLSFNNVKLRNKQSSCSICSPNATIKKLIDYEMFCGARATDKEKGLSILQSEDRIFPKAYTAISGSPHVLLDVRNEVELEICALPNTLNVPLSDLHDDKSIEKIRNLLQSREASLVVCICRRGNDSQQAVNILKNSSINCKIVDMVGGLTKWARDIDPTFPVY